MTNFPRPISPSLSRPLVCHRPFRRRGTWELRSGDELVGSIRFQGWVRPIAIAECSAGCWEFALQGWFRSHVVIRACSTGEDVAIFRRRPIRGGGTVEFPDGTRYEARARFRPLDLDIRLREGTPPFLSFRAKQLFRSHTEITIAPSAASIRDLALLVLFGCYVLLDMESSVAISIVG